MRCRCSRPSPCRRCCSAAARIPGRRFHSTKPCAAEFRTPPCSRSMERVTWRRSNAPTRSPWRCENGWPRSISLARCVAEFLAGDGRGVHETALGDGEHRHALLIIVSRRGGVLLPAARPGRRTRRTRACRSTRRDRHGADTGGKLERARCELIERALVLEKNDLTVGLAAGLEAHAHLSHGRIAHDLAVHEHPALAARTADDEAAFAYRRKHRVAVTLLEKIRAVSRVLEQRRRVRIVVGAG